MKVEIELPEIAGYEYTGESRTPLNGEWFMFEGEALNDRDQTSHYYILRKIPKPEPTLLERIEAAYEEKEVVLLEWDEHCDDVYMLSMVYKGCNWRHIKAQSMRNFQGYVYDYADKLQVFMSPVQYDAVKGVCGYFQPVAVLFNK